MLGRIYTIKCSVDRRVYVGSTFKTLDERLSVHVRTRSSEDKKHLPLYQAINEFGPDKFTIELIEEVDDIDKSMLRRIEGMHIEQHADSLIPLFNKNIAGRDIKQWREANKFHIKEQRKQYREANKEQTKQYREANKFHIKEQTKQYREANKDKIIEQRKQWREANKDKIIEQRKQWREANKDKIIEQRKQWREANKDKIIEQMKQTTICECGSTVRKNDLLRHKRTRKHVNWESSQ